MFPNLEKLEIYCYNESSGRDNYYIGSYVNQDYSAFKNLEKLTIEAYPDEFSYTFSKQIDWKFNKPE